MHFVYIDDSADEQITVFSALIIPADKWQDAFQEVRQFRQRLKRSDGIYVHKEIHAWEFVSGRGRIADRVVTKWRRCEIFKELLRVTANLPDVRLINAVFPKKADRLAFERLLNRVNVNMLKNNSHAVLICDEGKAAEYTRLKRRMSVHNYIPSMVGYWPSGAASKNIPIERVLEDPVFKPSDQSYFIQVADACAFLLLRRERPTPSKVKYGIHEAFNILTPILETRANHRDPEGIIRP